MARRALGSWPWHLKQAPRHPRRGLGENPNERLEKYVEACRAVAKENEVPLVDHSKRCKDAEAKGTAIRDWTTDGCHPNPRGHTVLADLSEPVLKKALE